MTKKDFERIASVLADVESRIETDADCSQYSDDQTSYASEILDRVIEGFCTNVSADHPRFKSETFKHYARPIRAHRLKESFRARLGM